MLDRGDRTSYIAFLERNGFNNDSLVASFTPVNAEYTIKKLEETIKKDPKYIQVLNSIFSRYCFNLFDSECSSKFFSGENFYSDDYFDFLKHRYLDMCKRDFALGFIDVSPAIFSHGYVEGCNSVLRAIREVYTRLNNHCCMVIHIPALRANDEDIQWKLYGDVVLFAEKHIKERIDRTYFRWKSIQTITQEHIPDIDLQEAEFEYAFQGFVFRDCFVVRKQSSEEYSLLLVFDKNWRDERPVNCPACRTTNIQGNSYPILNVRSWECKNPLCPDKSKYDRGKRYSFMSIMRQKFMEDEENVIPESLIAKWHLDCLEVNSFDEIFEMCVRFYSCVNDRIVIYTQQDHDTSHDIYVGRQLTFTNFPTGSEDLRSEFKKCAYFRRYLHTNKALSNCGVRTTIKQATVYNDDALNVLRHIDSNSIDGAVTSPPYYNAKAYSQWPNIYCYLYDMYNISTEIYRVLKPGSVYLFNIFDYFDNENNIVFSAMGKKRMILGAYMLDIFERIGFTIRGNIIWFKGQIQGHRSFNQGNMTPYYQTPLNCWEHIFILSKGAVNEKYSELTSLVRSIRPVIKMVRGENVLGHDAPFPKEIPEMLIGCMSEGDVVLDPFLGSGTTCIVANEHGIDSIGIEKDREYYSLCQRLIHNNSGLVR